MVMEQLCATLNRKPAAGPSSSTTDALLLALRGVSLAGESIGAEDASSFRKVREIFQLSVVKYGGNFSKGRERKAM